MILSRLKFHSLLLIFLLLGMLLVGACGQVPMATQETAAPESRLGTQWGEGLDSRVTTVKLRRAAGKPVDVNVLAYSAAAGDGGRLREVLVANGRVGLRVLTENGAEWPIYRENGAARLVGESGARYVLEYRNYSDTQTYEIVATVDGLDVLTGQQGSVRNRGYVLRPGATLRIKGFRKSSDAVAAFRFASAADSYAANSGARSVANVGVIGSAVFELIAPVPAVVVPGTGSCKQDPCAFPDDRIGSGRQYASPPNYRN